MVPELNWPFPHSPREGENKTHFQFVTICRTMHFGAIPLRLPILPYAGKIECGQVAGTGGNMAEKKQQKKTAKSHRSAKAGSKKETVRKKSARTKKPLLKKTPESKPGESDCAESQLVDGVAKVLDSVNCELSRNAQNVARGLVQQIGKGSITNLKRLADLRKEFGAKRGARNGLQELFEAIGREMESDPDNPVKTV